MKFKTSTSEKKPPSNVEKVIDKLKNKQTFTDVQEERIAKILMKATASFHPKMRCDDVLELQQMQSSHRFAFENCKSNSLEDIFKKEKVADNTEKNNEHDMHMRMYEQNIFEERRDTYDDDEERQDILFDDDEERQDILFDEDKESNIDDEYRLYNFF